MQRLDERGNSIMDKCLLDAHGIELTARLKSLYPVVQVIVISYRSGEAYVQHALAADARAYVVKDDLVRDRIPAVAAAIGGPPVADRELHSGKRGFSAPLVLLIVDGQTYALHLAAVGRVLLMERLGIHDTAGVCSKVFGG